MNKYSFVEGQIRRIISDKLNNDIGYGLDKNQPFTQSGIDSIDLLCMIVELERTFDITIGEEDFFSMYALSINTLTGYIVDKVKRVQK